MNEGLLGGEGREREFYRLWLLALATYGVGDTVTTIALIEFAPHVREANAVVATVVGTTGELGLALLKIAVFVVCVVASQRGAATHQRLLYYAPPVMLAVVGAFVTAYNLRLLIA